MKEACILKIELHHENSKVWKCGKTKENGEKNKKLATKLRKWNKILIFVAEFNAAHKLKKGIVGMLIFWADNWPGAYLEPVRSRASLRY